MNGGEISSNITSYGGGVCTYGTFTMSGGEISGNTGGYGGGVYVGRGTFAKSGGVISGNFVPSYGGKTVCAGGGKRRETDAGTAVKLYAYARYNYSTWTYIDPSSGGVGDTTAEWVE
jgi:hypothetical protein